MSQKLPVEFQNALKTAKKSFSEAQKTYKENYKDFEKIPPGTYEGNLASFEFGVSDDRPICKPKYKISSPVEYKGRVLFGDTLWLHNSGGQSWFISYMAKLEKEVESLEPEELLKLSKELVDENPLCKVKVSYKEEDDAFPKVELISKIGEEIDEKSDKSGEGKTEDGEINLDEMNRSELKQFNRDRELGIKVIPDTTDDQLRDAIKAAIGEEGGAEKKNEDSLVIEEMRLTEIVKLIENTPKYLKRIKDYENLTKIQLIKAIRKLDDVEKEVDELKNLKEEKEEIDLDEKAFVTFLDTNDAYPPKVDEKKFTKERNTSEKRIQYLSTMEYLVKELDEDSADLLKRIGLSHCIVKKYSE